MLQGSQGFRMKTEKYLEAILTAKVYDVAIETPL